MKISTAVNEFLIANRGEISNRTWQWYEQQLGVFIEFFPQENIEELTLSDLRLWRSSLLNRKVRYTAHPYREPVPGPLSYWTVSGLIRCVRRLCNWCILEGILTSNPASRLRLSVPPQAVPKAISDSDLCKLFLTAQKHNERDFAILCFLADTGCRVGGLVSLQVQDLDTLCATVTEKGNTLRKVYFTQTTQDALQDWLTLKPECNSVFVGKQGPLTTSGVTHVLRRLAKKAGVTGPHNPHAFRHAWARHALAQGADLSTVAQVLGHCDISVTHVSYSRWAPDELGNLARKYSPLNNLQPSKL